MDSARKGDIFTVSHALFWGLFPLCSVFALAAFSPLLVASLSWAVASVFFATRLTFLHKWEEVFAPSALLYNILAAFSFGVGLYGLLFLATKYTSPSNITLLVTLEILTTYLFFGIWRREQHKYVHIFGSLCMLLGAWILLFPKDFSLNMGDALVMLSNLIAPIANFWQQEARKTISSDAILFTRGVVGSISLALLAFFLGGPIIVGEVSWSVLLAIGVNGVLVLGLGKIFWIEAIHRISVARAMSLDAIAPLFTMIFAFILLDITPEVFQLFAFFPLAIGIFLLTRK